MLGGPPGGVLPDIPQLPLFLQHAQGSPGLGGLPPGPFNLGAPGGSTASPICRAKRNRDIAVQVALYTNPMSKHAVEHNIHLADIVTDLVDAISFGGQVIHATASNLPQMNKAVVLLLSAVQSLRISIAANE